MWKPIVALLLLAAPAAFGQSQRADRQTEAIKKQVQAISQDTLRPMVFGRAAPTPADTMPQPRSIFFSDRYTAYYTQAGTLQQVVVRQQVGFSSATTRYYFVQNEVVCVDANYVNATRMGSCGQIRFHNYYYLSKNQLIASQLSQALTGPYADCYPVVPAQELARLLQALQPALARLPAYSPGK